MISLVNIKLFLLRLDVSRPDDEVLGSPASISDGPDVGMRLGHPPPRPAPPSRPPPPTVKSPSQTKRQIPRVSLFCVALV
jgi:hypothetical protein